MRITIAKNEQDFDVAGAWRIVAQILNKQDAVIGLATGQTTIGMHKTATDIYRQFPFSTSEVTFFGVDEIVMVPAEYPGTCTNRLLEQIIVPLEVPPENFIMPATLCDDYERECEDFERRVRERGRIDLQILGIGMDGHIGMNLPGTPFEQGTWVTDLSGELAERIRANNNLPSSAPLAGITLGMKTMMNISKVVLAAKGKHKADIIKKALFGPITPNVPASMLRLHPNCEVLLDADAASEILS